MNIVTGYTGVPHITANEAQALNQGIVGTGNYVLSVGNKFAATLTDVNTVTIQDGEGMMQGVQFRIAPGDTDTVTIENGTTGYNRIDYICARYTKDAQTGVEAVSLVVIEGTPNASSPSAPSYNTGNVLDGDSPIDFPLYQVTVIGLTPSVSALFGAADTVMPVESGMDSNLWNYKRYSDGTYTAYQEKVLTADLTTSSGGIYLSNSMSTISPPSFSTEVTKVFAQMSMTNTVSNGVFIYQAGIKLGMVAVKLAAHASTSSATASVLISIEGNC